MDRKTFAIGLLSLTALMLSFLCFIPARSAKAEFAVKDSRFQMITVPSQKSGSLIYLIDSIEGKVIVLSYDISAKALKLNAAGDINKMFGN